MEYLPNNLFLKNFEALDVSKNFFMSGNPLNDNLENDHMIKYKLLNNLSIRSDERIHGPPMVQKLSHWSFYSLIENGVQIKRQLIPRTLWEYYNLVARCYNCNKFVLPDYCDIHHTMGIISAKSLVMDRFPLNMTWQFVVCQFNCTWSQWWDLLFINLNYWLIINCLCKCLSFLLY